MKIAAVVILYQPSADAISNIESYYDSVDKIFVFDNTESGSGIQESLMSLSKIKLFHDSINAGIPKRLNQASRRAIEEGFEWLLTMDQDTSFPPEAIKLYLNCVDQ